MQYYIQYNLPGHSIILQLSVAIGDPEHSVPPLPALTNTSLVFVLSPPPHVAEHLPTFHSPHSQSTETNYRPLCLQVEIVAKS